MALKWKYETYRKLYVREAGPFSQLPLYTRALAAELLKICDDGGVIHLGGKEPASAIAFQLGATKRDRHRLPNDIEHLIRDGYLLHSGDRLVVRNFVPAQWPDRTGHDRGPAPAEAPELAAGSSPLIGSSKLEDRDPVRVADDLRLTSGPGSGRVAGAFSDQTPGNHSGATGLPSFLPSFLEEKKKESGRSRPEPSASALEVAGYLVEAIRSHTPDFKAPNQTGWARDIDLAIRCDKRTPEQLRRVIDHAHRSADPFWRPNLLSGKKLRKHCAALLIRAQQGGSPPSARRCEPNDPGKFSDGEVDL